tara:strand:- start:209 stop:772 length:564 start_codon:yes stop_codon:yes gene_type:complete
MNKIALRSAYLEKRKKLQTEEIATLSAAIGNQLLNCPIWDASYYSLFLSIVSKKEIDTEFILTLLHGRDKEVCLPRMQNDTEIVHILLTDNTKIKTNHWGIPEPQNGLTVPPSEIEVVFIPLLAYDKKGHRVGYGKGFYDRFLSKCKPNTLKIGLSLFEPEEKIEGLDATDIPLDFCVTPVKVYEFK